MADTKSGYGTNGFSAASSDTPSQRTRAVLTVNNDDTDSTLATIRAKGSAPESLTHEQLRTVSGSKPTAFGMKPSTPTDTPKVPGVLDAHCNLYAKKPC